MIRFTNLTGAVEIGANCYLLEIGGKRILLDAGAHPKKEGLETMPRLDLVPEDTLDAIVLSHAHQDHIGSLPIAMRRHPQAAVLMTEATRLIGDVMLHNSVNVMLAEKADGGPPEYPLFTHKEIDGYTRRWLGRPLHQRFDLHGDRAGRDEGHDVTVEFFDAGHILGSAGTLIRSGGRSVFYAGDVQFDDQTISRAARFPDFADGGCDVMIMESTRGDRATPAGFTRRGEEERLAQAINDTFDRGGAVMIPLFALGKTQELLSMFHGFRQRGKLRRDCPIYIGGLGAKLTEIYDKLSERSARLQKGFDIMDSVAPYVVGGRNIADLRIRPGRIFALSSGMMSEKTLSNIVAREFLSQPQHSILFVGYADPQSPGGVLQAAQPGDLVSLAPDHAPEPVKCRVEKFNFSAHASRESIRDYVGRAKPKKLILVHGDPASVQWLAETLRGDLPEMQVVVPEPGVPIDL